ncbi:MAG TPA: tyrosine/phenylalanine carboxypeptidase domain-containing protein [Polyangiaceae bacterium]|nr:tyrosine/phenylalanine carboxypeptidase domain-containing protein [Polyangiaceae bacterium]
MTLRRRAALTEPVLRAARGLKHCEMATALLDRVRPLNLPAERARLTAAYTGGRRPPLELAYAARPELGDVRRALDEATRSLDPREVEQALLLERADELRLEAELAEHVGQADFKALAARRFALPGDDARLRQLAHAGLPEMASGGDSASVEPTHLSDDDRDPDSLLSQISRRVFAQRLPVRVELDAGLVALAAVADGLVRVRSGMLLSARVSRRIALHEVEGHLLPRQAGAELGGVFHAGSAHTSETEEGRALLLEERAGLLDAARKAELCRRYLAAASVRDGAEFWETCELLLEAGADLAAAVELTCRVHRGGGLGRELVYLAGYERVKAAFATDPWLERVLASGRVSLDAARRLWDLLGGI